MDRGDDRRRHVQALSRRRAPALLGQRQHPDARGQRAREREDDPHHEQQAEVAHHRHRREREHEEARRRRRRRGRDRRHAARGGALEALLPHARLDLDRVVDGEAEQHGQHADARHRQRLAGDRQRAEGQRRGEQRDPERKQPHPPPEDKRERGGHEEQRRDEQDDQRVRDVLAEVVDHDRGARHHVRAAVAQPPVGHRHRAAHERDRPFALALAERRLEPDLDERGVLGREQVGEARLRRARRLARVEDEAGDERRVVEPRQAGQAVAQAELHHRARELQLHQLLGLVGGVARPGDAPALAARDLVGRLAGLRGLLRRALLLARELVADLLDGLVDERAGAVDDLDGLGAGDLRARAVRAAERRDVLRRVAGQAALEPEDVAEVLREHQLRQRPADEDDHRVVAEALVVALRRLERRARAPDERVGPRGRAQRERGEQPRRHGEHDDGADHGRGPARDPGDETLEDLPGHRHQANREQCDKALLTGWTRSGRRSDAGTAPPSRRPRCSGAAGCTAAPASGRPRR